MVVTEAIFSQLWSPETSVSHHVLGGMLETVLPGAPAYRELGACAP